MRTVSAPVSLGVDYDYPRRPVRRTLPDGGESISFHELVISSISFPNSTGFAITSEIYVNPALTGVFTWLAPIAARFKQYRVASMRLIYIPIPPTNTQGNVVVFPSYDPTTQAPTDETDMVNNQDAFERVVWNGFYVDLDVTAMNAPGPRKFTRSGWTAGDLKTYDCLRLFLGGNNAATNSGAAMGKLFIEYEFVFYVPVSNEIVGPTGNYYAYNLTPDTLVTATPSAVILATLYDPYNIGSQATIGGIGPGTFTLPPGFWVCRASFSFRDSANENFTSVLQFYQAGNAVLPGKNTTTQPALANGTVTMYSETVIQVTGLNNTQYIQVVATITGAAGTLTILSGGSLTFIPA